MTMPWLVTLAGLLGLAVGSFLNVCIYRLPLEQSLAFPASHCTSCNRKLSWFENVPVLAWLVLRGRCRTCHTSISVVYPLVELFTGVMFALAAWHYGPGLLLVSRLLLGCMLIVLFFIDLRHRILPNVITVGGTVIGFIFSFVTPPGWVSSLIGLVIGGLIPFLLAEAYLRLRKIEGLGMGDVKMLALIGAFLGWQLVLLTLAAGVDPRLARGPRPHRDPPRRHETRAALRHLPRDCRDVRGGGGRAHRGVVCGVLPVGFRDAGIRDWGFGTGESIAGCDAVRSFYLLPHARHRICCSFCNASADRF